MKPRPRILIIARDSSRDDHAAIRDGVATALTAADAGRVERISARQLCVGTAGPFIRIERGEDVPFEDGADHAALLLDCLDRPVGNDAVHRAVTRALRLLAHMVPTDVPHVSVTAPSPLQGTRTMLNPDPTTGARWYAPSGGDVPIDPTLEALLPDVVLAGGTLTEIVLSPVRWAGRTDDATGGADAMEALRTLDALRRLAATMDERASGVSP